MPWIRFQNMEEYVKMTSNAKYWSFSIQLTNLMVKNYRWTVISYSALRGIPCCYGLQRLFMVTRDVLTWSYIKPIPSNSYSNYISSILQHGSCHGTIITHKACIQQNLGVHFSLNFSLLYFKALNKVFPVHFMKEQTYSFTWFLMLALDGGEWPISCPAMAPTSPHSPQGSTYGAHSIWGWVRHRASLDVFGDEKNILSQPHIEPHIIQPIA